MDYWMQAAQYNTAAVLCTANGTLSPHQALFMCLRLCLSHRFTEILQCAEGLSEEQIKQAIRKSRIVFNRQGVVTARAW